MSRRPSILIAVITAVLLLLGVMPAGASPRVPRFASKGLPEIAPPAQAPTERAFSISRNDGNDVPGPLDLASAGRAFLGLVSSPAPLPPAKAQDLRTRFQARQKDTRTWSADL